jgi:protease-4
VLFLDLENDFPELPEFAGFQDPFATPGPTLKEAVDAIDNAAGDKRVHGMVARMGSGSFDLTHSYELRGAIKRFRAAGKFAYIYSPSYGEGGGGLGRYYLASAFDEIWMQPLGVVSITGVNAEIPFAREVLDKIGLTPQFFQRKEYKSAMETFTNKEISAANKEETTAIVNDIRAEILREVPLERKMSAAAFESLVNKGLLTSKEALAANIIDHANYGDVLLDNIAEKVYGKRDTDLLELVDLAQYAVLAVPKPEGVMEEALGMHKPKVALVYAVGAIVQSADGTGDFSEGRVVAADDLAPVLMELVKDESYDALVLRVDSPGGSPTASESILRAVQKVKASGKPVIISMGSAAASGGYWISAYADRIFALPTTLTGSIGVFGGKVAIADLSKKIGINWEKISWGENAGLWSMNTTFTPSEAERMEALMDQVYDNFIDRVAKGRKLSDKTVDRIAGGRVWTGRQAVAVGLVDEIGGLNEALDYAAKLSGANNRGDVQVDIMPKPKTKIEQFIELLGGQVSMGAQNWKVQSQILEALKPIAQIIEMQKNPQAYAVFEPLRLED